LTAAGFLSPNFWLYALIAAPLLWRAGRKDTNPVALYLLMLHVVPPIPVIIPLVGNNGLFSIDNYRLLSICVLAPTAWRVRRDRDDTHGGGASAMDMLLLAFGVLVTALYTCPDLPYQAYIPDSPANMLRRGFLFLLDTYLLYWVVKRTCSNERAITEALAAFCLASVVMAAIGAFESLRGWLLYVNIASSWGTDPNAGFYLAHGSQLRAQVSAGHALSLGYLLAVAFAFWLYLKTRVRSKATRIGVTLILWAGLFASFARGAWLGAIASFFVFNAAGPRAFSRTTKAIGAAALFVICIALSPIGDRILDALPIFGGAADADLQYRQRLSQRGWELVMAHPWFGDQFPWPAMSDLRQGEGIIDLVNTYLSVGLNYGLTGLTVFAGFILLGATMAYVRSRKLARSDPDLALLGASLVAGIGGTLLMIADTSFILGNARMFYVLAGFAAAYARLGRSPAHHDAATFGRHDISRGTP
jgi:O-antigen ligase